MYNKVEEMLHAAKSNDLLNSNISKLNEFLGKKEKEEKKNCWLCILSIVGISNGYCLCLIPLFYARLFR